MNKEIIITGVAITALAAGGLFLFLQNKSIASAVNSVASAQQQANSQLPQTYYQSAALPSSVTDSGGDYSTGSDASSDAASAAITNSNNDLAAVQAETQSQTQTGLAAINASLQTGLAAISNSTTQNSDNLYGGFLSQFQNDPVSKVYPGQPQSVYGYQETPQGTNVVSFTYTGVGSNPSIYADPTINYSAYNHSINPGTSQVPAQAAAAA